MTPLEHATTPYQRLFEVRLLHHYWLDDGGTVFDALAADKQAARLLRYDIRPVLDAAPTPSTRTQLDRLHCVFRPTGQGFVVAAPQGTTIAADTQFSFVVSAAEGEFFNYTALTFRPRSIDEVFDPSDNTPNRIVYRYKENVPVLSNLTGATRGTGPGTTLFLSREYPAASATDQVEALVLSGHHQRRGGKILRQTGEHSNGHSRIPDVVKGAHPKQSRRQLRTMPIPVR